MRTLTKIHSQRSHKEDKKERILRMFTWVWSENVFVFCVFSSFSFAYFSPFPFESGDINGESDAWLDSVDWDQSDPSLGEINERFLLLKKFSTNTKTAVYLAQVCNCYLSCSLWEFWEITNTTGAHKPGQAVPSWRTGRYFMSMRSRIWTKRVVSSDLSSSFSSPAFLWTGTWLC